MVFGAIPSRIVGHAAAACLLLCVCSCAAKLAWFTYPFTAASILIVEYHRLPLTSLLLDIRGMLTMNAVDKHVIVTYCGADSCIQSLTRCA